MDISYIILALIGGLLLGGTLVYTRLEIRSLQQQISDLKALPRRHTYSTTVGLEDALAVLLDIQFRRDAETARLAQALDILRQVRGGPQSYQQDRPAGNRPEGWEK